MTSRSLFKYRIYNEKSKELLSKQELWFAKPDTLNDPFDCQVEYERILSIALKIVKKNFSDQNININDKIDKSLKNIGVCSFSRARKNQLMWSHYADEHKGFCIGFKEALFYPHPQLLKPIDVTYQSKHPFDKIVSAMPDSVNGEILETIANLFIKAAIGTKYTYWKYERERRIIRKASGAHKFTPKHITSIAFGLKMPKKNRKELRDLLRKPEWSHIKWYQAKKSIERFALEFELIN